MKISVIVPTYKPQAYLWECLDSIYNQTFPKADYELVLVLNGCCEPYNAQIKEWLAKHENLQVQYIQTDEGGVSNARNIALDKASGEYVTFIDDDDFVSEFFLKELYEKASPNTISLCYPYAFKDGTPNIQLPYRVTSAYEYCVLHGCHSVTSRGRKFFSGPCMKLIPMSFIQGRRFDVRFKNGEDTLFIFLISDKFKKISFTSNKAIYYRRVRENSAITISRSKWMRMSNSLKIIWTMSSIYFLHPFSYNFLFFFTRVLGNIHSIFKS